MRVQVSQTLMCNTHCSSCLGVSFTGKVTSSPLTYVSLHSKQKSQIRSRRGSEGGNFRCCKMFLLSSYSTSQYLPVSPSQFFLTSA